jgi:hypothetical protein
MCALADETRASMTIAQPVRGFASTVQRVNDAHFLQVTLAIDATVAQRRER